MELFILKSAFPFILSAQLLTIHHNVLVEPYPSHSKHFLQSPKVSLDSLKPYLSELVGILPLWSSVYLLRKTFQVQFSCLLANIEQFFLVLLI